MTRNAVVGIRFAELRRHIALVHPFRTLVFESLLRGRPSDPAYRRLLSSALFHADHLDLGQS